MAFKVVQVVSLDATAKPYGGFAVSIRYEEHIFAVNCKLDAVLKRVLRIVINRDDFMASESKMPNIRLRAVARVAVVVVEDLVLVYMQ